MSSLAVAYYVGSFIGRIIVNPFGNLLYPVIFIVTSVGSYYVYRIIRLRIRKKEIHKIIETNKKNKEIEIQEFLQQYEQKITQEKINYITHLDATSLLNLIKHKKIHMQDVVLANLIRVCKLGHEYNLISDVNFEEYIKKSVEIDMLIRNGKLINPPVLAGLPIALNDQIAVKNRITFLGYFAMNNNFDTIDSNVVKKLRLKGCFPLLKCNISQGGFCYDSSNKFIGTSHNPWNKEKSVGTGSEAALVASFCIPLALSCDFMGGLRISASLCGVYGFKPTSSRISQIGIYSVGGKINNPNCYIPYSIGPIARSIQDLILVCKNLFGEFPEDSKCNSISFDEEILKVNKPHTLGYFVDFDLCETATVSREAVLELVEKFNGKGYTFIKLDLNKFSELIEIGHLIFSNTEFDSIRKLIKNSKEDVEPHLHDFFFANSPKTKIKSLINLTLENRTKKIYRRFRRISLHKLIQYSMRFFELRQEFLDYCFSNNIEGILCPILPTPSIDIGFSQNIYPFNHFAFILYNNLKILL
jgi:Asp-tRNA(Asn)/Glu-tRNA(Gln) amidotransferase A subunit family amidase